MAYVIVPQPNLPPWRLSLAHHPVSLTLGQFDDGLLLQDCTRAEEDSLSGWFAVVVNERGQLCGLHKPGGAAVDKEALKRALGWAQAHARQTFELLARAVPAAVEAKRQ